ncbi:MAG: hypothetical protein EOP84_02675 [Verrucomicrobiaceae bacterium]|nr:MAG: hypothetical protein EOP84_02675 [Verrucomicrobiaceae bacterium]
MKQLMIVAACAVALGACQTKNSAPMPQLSAVQAPKPRPVKLRDVKWKVYNAAQLQKLIDDAKKNGTEKQVVLVALSPDGYENLSYNMLELERFIKDQKASLVYLQDTINGRAELGVKVK